MTKRLTQEEFIQKAITAHNNKYNYSKVIYTRSADKIVVTCPEHGDFKVTANNHVSKSNLCGCPECYGNKKLTLKDFIEKSKKTHGDKYDYSNVVWGNSQQHITIICPKHGEFKQTPTRHMHGRGCQKCGGTNLLATEALILSANKVHDGFYDYSLIPKTAKKTDKVPIVCPAHGQFEQQLKTHINNKYGCPSCSATKSKPEDELANFLGLYTKVVRRNRVVLAPKEIDIWLPEYNLGVEFHGLYWHTDKKVGKQHRHKWELAEKAGIRLIQIFSDEWTGKQDIIKSRLLAMLGKCETRQARKLVSTQIDSDCAREFLQSVHIQGAGKASKYYGLYDNDLLVAVASFASSRLGNMAKTKVEDEWEVIRYASIGRINGGFSKLFSAFKKDTDPKRVISYCDLRYGNGKLYEKSGFSLHGITEPDYWWVVKDKRVPRYFTQKHRLAKEDHPLHEYYAVNKTETQICAEAGWEKISGVGNQKWVWETQ